MCGIFGYVGKKAIVPVLINALKKLEYRGYDSAGICVSGENLNVYKKEGRITELEKVLEGKNIFGKIGIAHTRWATHGEPNVVNSHPHLDCKKEIAIVHNGIIENFHALKKLLEKEGHKIVSETDSEIIAHLIEKFYQGNLEEAVIRAIDCVDGTFGLVVMHKNSNELVAVRRGSPLMVGIGDGEMFVASDATAILEHTRRVIYLEDYELAVISNNRYQIKNLRGERVSKNVEEIKWELSQIEKKGYKHFMLKEIFDQPEAIRNTLRGRIEKGMIKLSLNFDVNSINRIVIVACGTSWHSGLVAKHFIEKYAEIPVEVAYASEFRYGDSILHENDLVIAISQSGETADTLAALRKAKSKGIKTMGVVNVVGSTISREVDSGIYIHAGPEIGVASTKAFTCQVISLFLLALYIRQKKGKELDLKILQELNLVYEKIKDILEFSDDIKKIAFDLKDSKNFLYLGRGINFPVAFEGALKLKEISYIHAEGYPAAELKHGPIALIDENLPSVFLALKDVTYQKILSNMQEVKARKGKIIALVNEDDSEIDRLADYVIKIPKTSEDFFPIVGIIPLQLLAYYIADFKNLAIDNPRNLAKSVTVE